MKKILFGLVLCLLIVACRKDKEIQIIKSQDYIPPVYEINVDATVSGIVIDETGLPISEALVSLGALTEETNEEGLFVFQNTTMSSGGTLLRIEKEGYFDGFNRFSPKADSRNSARITLLEKNIIGVLEANTGGTLSNAENIELTFPANSIVTTDGLPYQGAFSVAARWINPAAENLDEIMPGDLEGVDADGDAVALISYSMMGVELVAANGDPLQLGNGQKVSLTFPIPESHLSDAPAEIPLWYFEESTGLWEEEGQATLLGNTYVGEVAHFSFWNCDVPFPLVQLNGRVVTDVGGSVDPLAHAQVEICLGNLGCRGGVADADGYFSGKVPAGVPLDIQILESTCRIELYTASIGAYYNDQDLGDISVENQDLPFVKVSGSLLDCNDALLTDGWVKFDLGGDINHYHVGTDFFEYSLLNCEEADELIVKGFNYKLGEQGDALVFPAAEEIDLGAIPTCGNEAEDYFLFTLNGEDEIFDGMILSENDSALQIIDPLWFVPPLFLKLSDHQGIGEYSKEQFTSFGIGGIWFDFTGNIRISTPTCEYIWEDKNCVNTLEFNLTKYSGIKGEKVRGNFTGTIDVMANDGTWYYNLPFSGSFSLPLN